MGISQSVMSNGALEKLRFDLSPSHEHVAIHTFAEEGTLANTAIFNGEIFAQVEKTEQAEATLNSMQPHLFGVA